MKRIWTICNYVKLCATTYEKQLTKELSEKSDTSAGFRECLIKISEKTIELH